MKSLFYFHTVLFLTFFFFLRPIRLFGQETLTILHVNDTHSCLAPLAPRTESLEGSVGGIARAATVIGMTKQQEQNVITLHAGDLSIGDLFYNFYFGVPELKIMKQLGFDAMTIGNHEFDLTPSTLLSAIEASFTEGSFPLLSANAILSDPTVKPLGNFIQPFVVKDFGKFKVGVFGLTTPETNVFSLPSPVVIDTSFIEQAAAIVEKLRTQDCSVIICLSHLGLYYDKILAEQIPLINVVVSGHDHYKFSAPIEIKNILGNKSWIVQADAFYSHIGKMKLSVNGIEVKLSSYELIPLDENIPEEPTVKAVVDELIAGMEQTAGMPIFTQAIGYAAKDFDEVATIDSTENFDTPVGNLVTDAFREKTKTQIALQLGGSTAQKLYKGPIVPADVFRMIGYGFNTVNGLGYRIATFKMTGEELWKSLEISVSSAESNDELLAQTSGMRYKFNLDNPSGSRVEMVWINNLPIDPSATYTITANEFLINALPMFGVQISDVSLLEDVTEFQVVMEYISEHRPISPVRRGTITDVKNESPNEIPLEYKLEQNYPNPFNPSTTIRYSLPVDGRVTLKIYNLLSQEITTLVNQEQSSGVHKVEWNASGFASGMYFYSLEANKCTQTKKMILTK
jgi:2',3'-cyclic-nucleotide 2'-phosphodiesterase (5'-nucleotidase family)